MKKILWFIRRFWREFTCDHWNSQIGFTIDAGMHIVCCPKCRRTRLYFGSESKEVEDK